MTPSPYAIQRIEIFSRWVGFAHPSSHSARLTITRVGSRFVRQQALAATRDELPEAVLSRLLRALARPAIPRLDPTVFDMPAAVIERHYSSFWTNDCPSHLIRIVCDDGRLITIRSEAQHTFMLPLQIGDSGTGAFFATFDPELSRALADLMPEGYLDRDRLAGRSGMLERDREEIEREDSAAPPGTTPAGEESAPAQSGPVVAAEPAAPSIPSNHEGSERAFSMEKVEAELFRILSRQESPREAEQAERSGRLSERLLKRNSLETARDLLARGADPSIADSVGQTALMHAASPPFDRDRFRLLVAAGADIEARRDGLTGLHLACSGGEAEAAAEWVRAGADIRARAPGGATPLMLGATWPGIVRTLLDEGAEVNVVDEDGHSALVCAILHQSWVCAADQLEALQAMIDAGADVNLRDRAGVSPLGHAKKVLAEALLEEEVRLAFHPGTDLLFGREWNSRRLAEAVVALLAAAGASGHFE
jgi:hypothetical protein